MRGAVYLSCLILLNTVSAREANDVCWTDSCNDSLDDDGPLVLHSVAFGEGFNLRRDVFLRLLVAARLKRPSTRLVLPPWYRLPHWPPSAIARIPWSLYFNVSAISHYVPARDLTDLLPLRIDTVYQLAHFENAFEGGTFVEKWELRNRSYCKHHIDLWGLDVDIGRIQCVAFQGSASKLFELIDIKSIDRVVMFANAEVALHDEYGTAEYWRARTSMKFNGELVDISTKFIRDELGCDKTICDSFMSVHWRRRDFARSRGSLVPSVDGTAKQIVENSKKHNLKIVYVASDAESGEFILLRKLLEAQGVELVFYEPDDYVEQKFRSGGIAIIDQIICSRAAFFIGTHESTFTYRIQEEREILGLDSDTTFNRLCPDSGTCEKPSRWTIVH